MINYIIPLLEYYLDSVWVSWFLFPFIALAFLACIPPMIRQFFYWR